MTSIYRPSIELTRIHGLDSDNWFPNISTLSLTPFLAAISVKEGGNYGVTGIDFTLTNVTGTTVGLFTDPSNPLYMGAKDLYHLHIDNGNVSRDFFGYFGSWDGTYDKTPPTVVVFHGRDMRDEQLRRTISVNYVQTPASMIAQSAIYHMNTYPDDSPGGGFPIGFAYTIDGAGLDGVVTDANFADAHPTIYKAQTQILETAGYEQEFYVNNPYNYSSTNHSKVLHFFAQGGSYCTPNLSFVAKGLDDLTNNAVQIKDGVDYDDVANIVGIFANNIIQVPAWTDEWTDDPAVSVTNASWNSSAWNTSYAATGHYSSNNFSCNRSTLIASYAATLNLIGMNTSKCILAYKPAAAGAGTWTIGVNLHFPSYSTSSQFMTDGLNFNSLYAKKLRFSLATNYINLGIYTDLGEVQLRLTDVDGNMIQNQRWMEDISGGFPRKGGPGYIVLNVSSSIIEFEMNVDSNTARIGASEVAGYDWYYVSGTSFSWSNVKEISFYKTHSAAVIEPRLFIDNVYLLTDCPLNARTQTILLSPESDATSISSYGRRFKPLVDNEATSLQDAISKMQSELSKTKNPVKRLKWTSIDALQAKPGYKVTVDCPPYGVTSGNSNTDWGIIQATHEWRTGNPLTTTLDLMYPASPNSPSQKTRMLRLASFNREEALAALLDGLRDLISNIPKKTFSQLYSASEAGAASPPSPSSEMFNNISTLTLNASTSMFGSNVSVGGVLNVNNNIATTGTVDGIDISNVLNQAVKTTDYPTFNGLYINNNVSSKTLNCSTAVFASNVSIGGSLHVQGAVSFVNFDLDDVADGSSFKKIAVDYWLSGGKPYLSAIDQIADAIFNISDGRSKFQSDFINADLLAANAVFAENIVAGEVTAVKIDVADARSMPVAASDTLRHSDDAEKTTNSTTYVKVKEMAITQKIYSGCRLKWDGGFGSNAPYYHYYKIYKNGFAIGSERITAGAGYQTFSEDIATLSVGDLIQVYAHRNPADAPSAYVRNFRIYYDIDIGRSDPTNQDP